jgi:hypothetical protein
MILVSAVPTKTDSFEASFFSNGLPVASDHLCVRDLLELLPFGEDLEVKISLKVPQAPQPAPQASHVVPKPQPAPLLYGEFTVVETHVEMVIMQTNASREDAIAALRKCNGDIVHAIMVRPLLSALSLNRSL